AHRDRLRGGLDRDLLDGLWGATRNVGLRQADTDPEDADAVLSLIDVARRVAVLTVEVLSLVRRDAGPLGVAVAVRGATSRHLRVRRDERNDERRDGRNADRGEESGHGVLHRSVGNL